MIRSITEEYDIKHTGEENDRLEILMAFQKLAKLCETCADVEVTSEKSDLICVKISTFESP